MNQLKVSHHLLVGRYGTPSNIEGICDNCRYAVIKTSDISSVTLQSTKSDVIIKIFQKKITKYLYFNCWNLILDGSVWK